MNDFEGLLPSDYGFKPSNQPISGSRSTRPASTSFSGGGSGDADSIFSGRSNDLADVLGGSARHGAKSPPFDLDSVFDKRNNNISEPVFDKPLYDDDGGVGAGDIFDGVPGIRSSSSSSKVKYEDVFTSSSSSPPRGVGGRNDSAFDDLLGGFGKAEPPRWKSTGGANRPEKSEKSNASDFDDLLPGFGVRVTSPPTERSAPDANKAPETFANASKTTSKVVEDPFITTGQFSDPLEEMSRISNSRSTKFNSVGNGGSFDDVNPFEGLMKTTTTFSSERENRAKEASTLRTESNTSGTKNFSTRETQEKPSVRSPDSQSEKNVSVENDWDSQKTFFEMPTASTDTYKSFGQTTSPPSYDASASFKDLNAQTDRSPSSEENTDSADDIWLSVSEVPLFTQPTSAPPPSRPPPPRPVSKAGLSKGSSANTRRKNEYSSFPNPSQSFQVPNSTTASGRGSVVSPIDELEDFASGRNQDNVDEHANGLSGEEMEMNSVAAAMKEAMDRAQAKFRQAKEVRERENTKASRSKEGPSEREERLSQDERAREKLDRLERQRRQREMEEQEMEREKLERARERANEREREERERDQRRLEKEKERFREERERENERDREERERDQRRLEKEKERFREDRERANRLAVERATREARERAALEAKLRVERAKIERAAVDKVTSEARERAERASVQRAQSEARERAAADAKERAERAAAESRERANSDLKEKEARERAAAVRAEAEARTRAAERAAVGRAASEARERAAVDARDRAAAAARANQQKNDDDDLESFFSSRASSAPKPRAKEPFFDAPSQSKSEVPRAPTGNSSNIKKASSATNIVDDLSSIFNAAPSSGGFHDVEGETDERRRARLERHQRTQERAAKALEEKNQRDLQNQREQAERSRIGETLDVEIKRWAAGKEGNLRALLSTMQYVLWPESGWQAVSLTDMITAASVKKVYRKATLCIHPDKVQQKGATLQQKYVAEKVFDLLKEAWNKFNSEELF